MLDAETPTVAASLRRLASSLRRDAWLIVLCAAAAVVTAVALTGLREPQYEATSRLVVGTSGDLVGASGGAWTQSATRTVLNLLDSDVVLADAARQVGSSESGEALGRRLTTTAQSDSAVIVLTLRDRGRAQATRTLATIDTVFIRAVANQLGPIPAAEDGSQAAKPLVRVFDPPHAAASPVGTPALLVAILAGVVGGGLGVGLALLRDSLRRTRGADLRDLEHVLGAPVIAVLPPQRRADRPARRRHGRRTASRLRAARYELLRHLRVTGSGELARPRVVVVVAATDDEGVGHVGAETALALAQEEHAVVSVGSDVVRPSARRRLGRVSQPTTQDSLATRAVAGGDASPDLQLVAGPLTGARGTLHHLDGPRLANGAGSLDAEPWRRLLARLEGRADWIVIASPPLDESMTALDLVDLADDVLLVVSARSARDEHRNALRESLAGRAGLRGAIVAISANGDIRRLDGAPPGHRAPGTAFADIPVLRGDRGGPSSGSGPSTRRTGGTDPTRRS